MAHVDPEQAAPTPEQAAGVAQAGGQAAGTAAEQGQTPEQAQAATAEAMRAQAAKEGVALSDEDCNKIAETTIKLLEARGAFEQAPPAGQTETPSTPPDGGSSSPATSPSEASSPAPPPSTPPATPSEEPPRKRTFAERFQGKN
jgi:hypothetical protein